MQEAWPARGDGGQTQQTHQTQAPATVPVPPLACHPIPGPCLLLLASPSKSQQLPQIPTGPLVPPGHSMTAPLPS